MDVLDAIRDRRTIGKIGDQLPPREVIEELLEAATWAPNHRVNEPWRFFVLAGDARVEFGKVMAEDQLRHMPQATPEQRQAIEQAQHAKATRSPVIIVVAVDPPKGKDLDVENIAAASAAIQNMLLVAHARGLATKWSTGAPAVSDYVKEYFGLTPQHHLLAFIYLGYAAQEHPRGRRTPHHQKTTWLGWPAETPAREPSLSAASA